MTWDKPIKYVHTYLLFKNKVWPSKPIFHLISTVHCNYVARKSKEKIESSIYSVCLRHKFANSLEKKSTKTLVCLNILFVYIGSQTICMQFTQSKRLIHCMYYLLSRRTAKKVQQKVKTLIFATRRLDPGSPSHRRLARLAKNWKWPFPVPTLLEF